MPTKQQAFDRIDTLKSLSQELTHASNLYIRAWAQYVAILMPNSYNHSDKKEIQDYITKSGFSFAETENAFYIFDPVFALPDITLQTRVPARFGELSGSDFFVLVSAADYYMLSTPAEKIDDSNDPANIYDSQFGSGGQTPFYACFK